MIPIMVIFAGIPQHTAQGISLLAMIPPSTLGVLTHWRMGNIRVGLVPGLIVGTLAGVWGGGSFAHLIAERELGLLYSVLLVYTAFRYLRTKPQRRRPLRPPQHKTPSSDTALAVPRPRPDRGAISGRGRAVLEEPESGAHPASIRDSTK
jgi:uncharacterized membrane protein YfcA